MLKQPRISTSQPSGLQQKDAPATMPEHVRRSSHLLLHTIGSAHPERVVRSKQSHTGSQLTLNVLTSSSSVTSLMSSW